MSTRLKFCKKCNAEVEHSPVKCKKARTGIRYRCRPCMRRYDNEHRERKLLELVGIVGGECHICGFDKSFKALDFHHLRSEQKSFTISDKIQQMSLTRILPEIRKCAVLCANCHRLLHGGEHFCLYIPAFEFFKERVDRAIEKRGHRMVALPENKKTQTRSPVPT